MLPLFENTGDELILRGEALAQEIAGLEFGEQVRVLNAIREALHQAGPFCNEPVDCVVWLPAEQVESNDYNPNRVAPPEMRLLEISIEHDGYTQPVVVYQNGNPEVEVVDGAHRTRVGKESSRVRKRTRGYIPCSVINGERGKRRDRIAATIRHNRARGVHGIQPMTDIVAELIRLDWLDDDIAKELGMDADEVLRFKQQTGLTEIFAQHEYGRAWE